MRDMRKIIHVDMDAFYASVEQRDHAEYRGKPVIVGGPPASRGVVAACSYEARRYGVHSAMPSAQAHRLCPQAIFVRPRFEVYRRVSLEVQEVFREFTGIYEPLSLDEAFLDVTGNTRWGGSATLIAREIKTRIRLRTGLTASAGVSYNKFLAKIASGMNKPDGLFVITPEQGEAFIAQLPVGKFFGVGKATEERMHKLGIFTGEDLRLRSEEDLVRHFGKTGRFFYGIARGVDERPVIAERERKSLSKETTFEEDLRDPAPMLACLLELSAEVAGVLRKEGLKARTMFIKVKYADFKQVTRSVTLENPMSEFSDMQEEIKGLLQKTDIKKKPVRLLGFGVSGFVNEAMEHTKSQANLFE
ncbi:MAG TPA: DNA polymerase IV [Gammaproteobacteria bacterium]|nr:DNA polymerase IV [Gammaproteobacteria bacterium]